MPTSKKFYIGVIIVFVTVIGLYFPVFRIVEKQYVESLHHSLQEHLRIIATTMSAADFQVLTGKNMDLYSYDYKAMKDRFIKIGDYLKKSNIRWIYAMRKTSEGILFLVDSVHPGDPFQADPGTPYKDPPQQLTDMFQKPESLRLSRVSSNRLYRPYRVI